MVQVPEKQRRQTQISQVLPPAAAAVVAVAAAVVVAVVAKVEQ